MNDVNVMNENMDVGIVGYGAYVPRLRISIEEIARVWGKNAQDVKDNLLVDEKSVPEIDEDTITISVESGRNALLRANIEASEIGALFIGSESHPYAVKPSGTVVAEALGATPNISIVDTQFACRAGTTNIFICMGLVKSGYINYGMAIGADTSQGRPGDALEFTAAAGGAAFIIGRGDCKSGILAKIVDHTSYVTDTPDFWRREGRDYPRHGGRFTGEPAYFSHVISASKNMLEKTGLTAQDFDYCVFHMPNGKFPAKAAKILGFSAKQLTQSLIVRTMGNCYSGSSLVGLCNVLDIAKAGQRIFMTSYGSGAGSDSFVIEITGNIEEKKARAPLTQHYLENKINIDYGIYAKLRRKLKL